MPRRFNTAGPNDPVRHYTIPAVSRLRGVREIIEHGGDFVLHAPRKTGKTTALLELCSAINRDGKQVAAVLSMEPAAAFSDVDAAELAALDSWRYDLAAYLPAGIPVPRWPDAPPGNRIGAALSAWACESPRPVVVLLDGVDSLKREVRASVLSQLHAGQPRRPRAFPWSIGLTALRDPGARQVDGGPASTAVPAFESIALRPLGRDEVAALLSQHTEETSQQVLASAIDRAFELTQGQPFLLSALARHLAEDVAVARAQPVTAVEVERAKDILLERRGGHLDEIEARLREGRLRTTMQQILNGGARDCPAEDARLAEELGLLRVEADGRLVLACPLLLGLLSRLLPGAVRTVFPPGPPAWINEEGRLDPARLLQAFLDFWRRHGESLFSTAPYSELSPLVLTAFLQRVATAGGIIEREYAIGRGRMEVCIRQGGEALAIVVKVRRDSDPDPAPEGLVQLDEYLERKGLTAGWLVVFDRRKGLSPLQERLLAQTETTPRGRAVTVVRG